MSHVNSRFTHRVRLCKARDMGEVRWVIRTFDDPQRASIAQSGDIPQFREIIQTATIQLQGETRAMTRALPFEQHLLHFLYKLATIHLERGNRGK